MENKEFIKIVHASILGDGYFYKVDQNNDRANTHYMLKQISVHADYVEWMASYLEQLTSVTITKVASRIDDRGYNCSEQLVLKTMRHPTYKKMYNRLYQPVGNTHVKRLDSHYIELFDWQTLAIMYMDDGWIDVAENKTKENYVRLSIATHCFTYFENKVLRDLIAERFNIHCDVKQHKQKNGTVLYYLNFKKDNAKLFIDGVKPFIFKSFNYKLEY